MSKVTFKTEKSTGRYASFYPDTHHIKYNKQEVGAISDKSPHSITLRIVDGNSWRWITLKGEFKSIDEAKEFVSKNFDAILAKWDLYDETKKIKK